MLKHDISNILGTVDQMCPNPPPEEHIDDQEDDTNVLERDSEQKNGKSL